MEEHLDQHKASSCTCTLKRSSEMSQLVRTSCFMLARESWELWGSWMQLGSWVQHYYCYCCWSFQCCGLHGSFLLLFQPLASVDTHHQYPLGSSKWVHFNHKTLFLKITRPLSISTTKVRFRTSCTALLECMHANHVRMTLSSCHTYLSHTSHQSKRRQIARYCYSWTCRQISSLRPPGRSAHQLQERLGPWHSINGLEWDSEQWIGMMKLDRTQSNGIRESPNWG